MILLALETSSSAGSVAVGADGTVLADARVADRGAQAATLVRVVADTLREAGVDRRDLDGIVVGEGPGSFTGVRVAAATAKGLAHALNRPLWAVPSTASAAMGMGGSPAAAGTVDVHRDRAPAVRYVLFDARADRVYGACYRQDPATGRLETLIPLHGGALGEVLDGDLPDGVVFAGDAALRHRQVIEASGRSVVGPPMGVPTAAGLLRYLWAHPEASPIEATGSWEPRYVRASNAEREWSR